MMRFCCVGERRRQEREWVTAVGEVSSPYSIDMLMSLLPAFAVDF